MKRVHVRPTGGRRIRHHDRPSQILRPEGDLVNLDDYWRGRIADGDVEVVPDAPPRAKPSPTPRKARPAPPAASQE
jgi:hypothetical protein